MPESNGAPSFSEAAAAMQTSLETANADAAPNTIEAQTPVVEATPAANATETPATETPAVETPVVPSLDGLDLSGLKPEDAKKIQDGFLRQQDYTRKTQEIAPLRKLVEEVGDFDKLRQSYDFVTRLENDPDFLAQVASELQEYAAKPAPVTTEQTPAALTEIPQGADPTLVKQINDLNEWRAQQENERNQAVLVAEWENKITTQLDAIQESNPTYTQEDIDTLHELAPAHDYDYFKAQEHMEKLRHKWVNDAIRPKLNHPSAANPVPTGSLATQPTEIRSFEDAAAATRERMRVTQ